MCVCCTGSSELLELLALIIRWMMFKTQQRTNGSLSGAVMGQASAEATFIQPHGRFCSQTEAQMDAGLGGPAS